MNGAALTSDEQKQGPWGVATVGKQKIVAPRAQRIIDCVIVHESIPPLAVSCKATSGCGRVSEEGGLAYPLLMNPSMTRVVNMSPKLAL